MNHVRLEGPAYFRGGVVEYNGEGSGHDTGDDHGPPCQVPKRYRGDSRRCGEIPALSPAERIRAIRGMLVTGAHLMKISPKAAWARQYAEEQQVITQRNIQEFIAGQGY